MFSGKTRTLSIIHQSLVFLGVGWSVWNSLIWIHAVWNREIAYLQYPASTLQYIRVPYRQQSIEKNMLLMLHTWVGVSNIYGRFIYLCVFYVLFKLTGYDFLQIIYRGFNVITVDMFDWPKWKR